MISHEFDRPGHDCGEHAPPIRETCRRRHGGTWSGEPVAFTQGTVTPKHIVNGALFLFGPKDRSEVSAWRQRGAKLPPGKYLIKAYAELNGRLANDPTVMLGEKEFQGQVVVENAKWQPTFPMAEVVSAGALEK